MQMPTEYRGTSSRRYQFVNNTIINRIRIIPEENRNCNLANLNADAYTELLTLD